MSQPRMVIPLPTGKLTPREAEVLTLTAYGKTRGEISQILAIKSTTIKEHMERMFDKLNVTNITHASTVAVVLGLIAPYRPSLHQLCPYCRAMSVLQLEDEQTDAGPIGFRNISSNQE